MSDPKKEENAFFPVPFMPQRQEKVVIDDCSEACSEDLSNEEAEFLFSILC